jgi:hypothetical protein
MIQYLSNHQVCHIWHAVNCYTICQARQPWQHNPDELAETSSFLSHYVWPEKD